jgi:hypothetical protein
MSSRVELSRAVNDQCELKSDWAAFDTTSGVPGENTVLHEISVNRDLVERFVWIACWRDRSGTHLIVSEVQFLDDNTVVASIPVTDMYGLSASDLAAVGFGRGATTTGVPCRKPYVRLDPLLGDNYSSLTQTGGAGGQQPTILLCVDDGSTSNVVRLQCFALRVRCQRIRYLARKITASNLTKPIFTGVACLSQYP